MSGALSSAARVPTAVPRRYLAQLCKHFQHKIPVEFDDTLGRIEFSAGICRLDATEEGTLSLMVTAGDAAGLTTLEDVVARHLKRFAFREDPEIGWTRTA